MKKGNMVCRCDFIQGLGYPLEPSPERPAGKHPD
jgi:hypothetical protein